MKRRNPFDANVATLAALAFCLVARMTASGAELRGLWEFQDSSNLGKATVGHDLIFSGTPPSWAATLSDDASGSLSGVITTVRGAVNRILAPHGIPANGGGTLVNQASWVMDVFSPAGSRSQWRTLFQTDLSNVSDGDYFIRNTDDALGVGAIGYSSAPINETVWTRLVITMDLTLAGNDFKTYLNGSLFHTHAPNQSVDGRFALQPGTNGVLMFTDEDGEDYPLHVAGLAIYEGALTPQEVALLGGPGQPMTLPDAGQPPIITIQPAGPSNVVALAQQTFTFTTTDPEGANVQIQVDWGNGRWSDWTPLGPSAQSQEIQYAFPHSGQFTLRARARDVLGATSDWVLIQEITVMKAAGLPDGLVGLWEFNDPQQLGKATYGADLAVVGTPPSYSTSLTDAQSPAQTLHGVITTIVGIGNHLRATHEIGANGYGSRANRYTLMFDVLVPGTGQWRCFYQTALANNNDGEYFVRNSDQMLGRGTIGYSGAATQPDRWYRLVLAVDLTANGAFRAYLDGELFHQHARPTFDGEYSLDPSEVLLFADENNENAPLVIGVAAVFSKTLTAEEVSALGGPGLAVMPNPNNQPPTLAAVPAGPAQVATGDSVGFTFHPDDPDGDLVQVQADWGDGKLSSWSGLAAPGASHSLAHTWTFPGDFEIRGRARDINGAVSDWVNLQSISVTGAVMIAFSTPPYLQNMSTTTMVVMAELFEDVPLVLRYGTGTNYGGSVAMESVASGGGTFFLRAVLTNLQPDTTYHYVLASTDGDPVMNDATFRTAPSDWIDFSFGTIGDTQTDNRIRTSGVWAWEADPWEPAKTMLRDMVDRGVHFGLGIGDHAQDGNSYTSTKNSHLDRWAALLGPHVPFYIAWGNHDGNSPEHPLRLSADMPSRWHTDASPSIRTPGFGNFSFSYSGVFFVCLDYFEVNTRAANDPANDLTNGWLDEQLSSPAARDARFRVVAVHVPPYCERWIDGSAALRAQLVPRLEQYQVNLCFSGHMHGYERGYLNGVHYIVAGGGSYLDIGEVLVQDWPHVTLGGYDNVPGSYAMQNAFGVLGTPQPIEGGLFHGYAHVSIRERYLRLDMRGFNADGSYIGILDTLEIGSDPGPDTDGDGMRDAWETDNGLDPADPSDAQLDADDDGMTNLQEYHAGTDPQDPASRFEILDLELVGNLLLRWSSVPGKSYRVAWSENLFTWNYVESTPGQPLTVAASSGATTEAPINPPPTRAALFLRMEVLR
ncbi:MAG: metallophosphoesterase [Verrucomicrobiae bacterium]|nr:metallophosphoesterase [Verrucomicrobiae bacterium]